MVATPDDATLLVALQSLRIEQPAIGRAKVLQQLRLDNGWQLSEKRLKACMDTHHLNTEEIELRKVKESEEKTVKEALPTLPAFPLQEQLRYRLISKRYFILYGTGEYDFGVTPNMDMAVVFEACQRKTVDFLKVFNGKAMPEHRKTYLSHQGHVQTLWQLYQAAAKVAGISKEHARRQFEAEYKTDPTTGEEQVPIRAARAARRKAAEYKVHKIELLRVLHKSQPDLVPLDSKGNPIFCLASHGQFALCVVKVDKAGRECGRIA